MTTTTTTTTKDKVAAMLAGIDAGDIVKLPGMARRNVALNEFDRVGLAQLSRKSWIRSQPRHYEAHNARYMDRAVDAPNIACIGCKRTLGEMFNYTEREYIAQSIVKTAEYVRFVSRKQDNDKHGVYACFDCAIDRDGLLASMAAANVLAPFADCIASDGLDVFAFVQQSIIEDRLHGTDGWQDVELRLLHGGKYGGGIDDAGNSMSFHRVIGGRMLYHRLKVQPLEAQRERARLAREHKAMQRAEKSETSTDTEATTTDGTGDSEASDMPVQAAPDKPKRRRPAKYARD